ncbi:astrocytic phosphoprotein PEA-15-like isoform X2 [Ptychodera flava]
MARIDPLASLYVDLNEFCIDEDLDTLKVYVKEDISPRQLQKMRNATDIFRSLEDKGLISKEDVSYLKELFEKMGKAKLVKMIEQYEKKYITTNVAAISSTKTVRATSSDRSEPVSTTGQPEQPPGRREPAPGVTDKIVRLMKRGLLNPK